MRIDFVNHSSLIVRENGVSLMCDFWKDGSIFDNGWDLLCETPFDYSDFSEITHLWFSHEHPDHFSPQNLGSIPSEFRKKITILFQETLDKRLVSFCRKLDFKEVIEMKPYEPIEIGNAVRVTCAPYGAVWADVDSWLLVETPSATLLNINDCEIESNNSTKEIQNYCGKIDVLATQFSFASKQGEESGDDWVQRARAYHLDKLNLKLASFEATYAIPFASFVYWSHQENCYLNQGAVPLQDAVRCIAENDATPIVMYPEDEWIVGSEWQNAKPLQQYAERYEWLRLKTTSDFRTSISVSQEQLIRQANQFLVNIKESASERQILHYIAQKHSFIRNSKRWSRIVNRLAATFAGFRGKCECCLIYVEDHRQAYGFSITDGLIPVDLEMEECHIRINSQALEFGFSAAFGGETLQINGRFQNIQKSGWAYLSEIFFLARRLEQKYELPRFVVLSSLVQIFGRFESARRKEAA